MENGENVGKMWKNNKRSLGESFRWGWDEVFCWWKLMEIERVVEE
jgi:hypothetical protein